MLKSLCTLLTLCILASATTASAQPISEERLTAARESFRAGKTKLETGDYQGALTEYRIADAVVKKPSTRIGIARALVGLGRFVEARKEALSVADMPALPDEHPTLVKARQDAAALALELNGRVARLSFTVVPSEAELVLDNQLLTAAQRSGLDVDPGKHTVRVSGPGLTPQEQTFELKVGEKRTIELTLQSSEKAPPQPLLPSPAPSEEGTGPVLGTVSWIGIGIAGAGLIVGTVAGGITLSRTSDIEQNCTAGDGNDCLAPEHGNRRAALTSAHISTAGFALTGAGVAVGLLGLFVLDKRDQPEQQTTAVLPLIGPGFLGVQGIF